MATFASRLAQLRKERNMSQHQLANALQMAHGSIGNYESGSRFPRYEDLEAIADYFNVELDYLCGRTNERPELSLEEQWIIQCYKNADADTKEAIKLILRQFDKKDMSSLVG